MQERMSIEMMAIGINGLFFPLNSVLIGIGLLMTSQSLRSIFPILILIGGLSFFIAEGPETDWGLEYFYPLGGVYWLIGFGKIGLGYFAKQS